MADLRSVNSPRRILSLSRRQRESFSFRHADDNASGFGLSGEHSPKPAEVYGFVGSISTVVATVIFLIWAYVPEAWLHGVGIFYYPSRYWALAIPVFCTVTIVLGMGFYIGLNFMSTLPPTSLNVIYVLTFASRIYIVQEMNTPGIRRDGRHSQRKTITKSNQYPILASAK